MKIYLKMFLLCMYFKLLKEIDLYALCFRVSEDIRGPYPNPSPRHSLNPPKSGNALVPPVV